MNSENNKISDPHGLLLNLSDKLNLQRSDKYISLSNPTIYIENCKKSYKNSEFKISAPTRSDKFTLLEGSYSASDTHDYFDYIIKKHETATHDPLIRTYVNKIENRITFKNKTVYYL